MLKRIVKQARERKILLYKEAVTKRRVKSEFLYHAGFSYRRAERMTGRTYEAVRQWYHKLAYLFDPEHNHHLIVVTGEVRLYAEGAEVYIWAATGVETFRVIRLY